MARYVGAIDQGTASTRCMIFDHEGREVARHQLAHEQIRPADGQVEHDPHEIWEATQDVVEAALGRAGATAADLAAIGITSQRGTTVVWDRRTGEPYHHAIVWQDTRTGSSGAIPERDDSADLVRRRTGLPPGSRHCAGKIQWILENVDGARADADAGHAVFGTIDTWLIWWLTGGPDGGLHLTDVTHASHTMLMDLESLDWDDELLALFDIPRSMLPQIRASAEVLGHTVVDGPFSGEVAIAADLGDEQAALLGQVCVRPGDLRIAHGAAALVAMLNTGTEIVRSTGGLLTTVAYRLGDAPPVYALEGPPGVSGTVPEAVRHLSREVVDTMLADADLDLHAVRVDGPGASDDRSMQVQADVLGAPVSRPVVAETAALGAAYCAGLATGFWSGTHELAVAWHESRRWEPDPDASRSR